MSTVMDWFKRLSSSDNRRAPRTEWPLLVAYYWDGSVPMAHKIKNISSTGFYLLTKERWHPGTVISMTLQRSDVNSSADHYISVLSKVIRMDQDGAGLAFVPLEGKSSGSAHLPKHKLADKEALGRFLERLKSDQGHAIPGDAAESLEIFDKNAASTIPGGVMKRFTDESGQALIIAALCMTCLLGFVALAADVGVMLREKRLVQIAADSGAIAGASELNFTAVDGTTVAAVAKQDTAKNGFTDGSGGATVTVNTPPTSGPHQVAGYVEVIVSQNQPTLFMWLFGRSSMAVTARAVATLGGTNGCIYTLGTSGADLSITGNADISIATCGIVDDSSSSNALSLTGNAELDAQSIGIVGGVSKTGNVTITPTPVTGIVATSDPLSFLSAPVVPTTCSANPSLSGNVTRTLNPGCYSGLSASGNITLNLNPGLYIINGNLNLTGNIALNGTGVTLVLEGSTGIPGNVSLNLSAPTSGTYDGVLIFQPSSNTNSLSLTGNSGSVFQGIVYAPNAAVTLTGNSGSSIYADFIAKSLSLVGNSTLNDYASVNSSSVLTAVHLVE